jgi:hypothetical protein
MKKVFLFLFILLVFPATAQGASFESEEIYQHYIPLVIRFHPRQVAWNFLA